MLLRYFGTGVGHAAQVTKSCEQAIADEMMQVEEDQIDAEEVDNELSSSDEGSSENEQESDSEDDDVHAYSDLDEEEWDDRDDVDDGFDGL